MSEPKRPGRGDASQDRTASGPAPVATDPGAPAAGAFDGPDAADAAAAAAAASAAVEAADAADRAAVAAAKARRKNRLLVVGAGAFITLVVVWLVTRPSGPPAAVDARSADAKIVAERQEIAEGTMVQVYFRVVPAGGRSAAEKPYTQSFPVKAEKSPLPGGGGAIRLKQLLAGFAAAGVSGKIIETWIIDKKTGAAIEDWRSTGASALLESSTQKRHLVDAEGRAVLFVDVETWSPGQPERDCSKELGCTDLGRCTGREGVCVAAGPEDCKKSAPCRDLLPDEECLLTGAACVRGPSKTWKPASAADCEASRGCKVDGKCGLVEDACFATKDEHCRASESCTKDKRCERDDRTCK